MLQEFNEHKDNFESSALTDVEETRFRLQLVHDLIPKIKQRYYFLRRRANDKPAFEAHCSSFMSTYGLLVGRMTKFVGQTPTSTLESTRVAQDNSSLARRKSSFHRSSFPNLMESWTSGLNSGTSLSRSSTEIPISATSRSSTIYMPPYSYLQDSKAFFKTSRSAMLLTKKRGKLFVSGMTISGSSKANITTRF